MLVVPAVFVFFYAFNAYILCIVSGFGKCDAQHEEYLVFLPFHSFLDTTQGIALFYIESDRLWISHECAISLQTATLQSVTRAPGVLITPGQIATITAFTRRSARAPGARR